MSDRLWGWRPLFPWPLLLAKLAVFTVCWLAVVCVCVCVCVFHWFPFFISLFYWLFLFLLSDWITQLLFCSSLLLFPFLPWKVVLLAKYKGMVSICIWIPTILCPRDTESMSWNITIWIVGGLLDPESRGYHLPPFSFPNYWPSQWFHHPQTAKLLSAVKINFFLFLSLSFHSFLAINREVLSQRQHHHSQIMDVTTPKVFCRAENEGGQQKDKTS